MGGGILAFLLVLSAAVFGCDSPARPRASAAEPSSTPPVAEPSGQGAKPQAPAAYRYVAAGRVVAIGDLHGDVAATQRVLRVAGLIDAELDWIGGNATLVQTGDQLDRGDDELQILQLLQRLRVQASEAGGQLVVLNGNHETMNVAGDYRYVTGAGRDAFASPAPASPLAERAPPELRSRAAAFLPGGEWALHFASRGLIAVVGDSVFAHGGVLPDHVRYGIDRLNSEVEEWMRGERPPPKWVSDPEGPVWTRQYGVEPVPARTCKALAWVLKQLEVKRLVVGHTPQKGGISSGCNGQVFRIDVGLASYYGDNPVQALEITSSGTRVLSDSSEGEKG